MGRTSDARERLLNSAVELFYSRSYGSVGVQELCERAEINKGSFYHFFDSKENLTLAALERQSQSMQRELLEPAFASNRPPLQRIENWVRGYGDLLAQIKAETGITPGCHFGNLAAELSTQNEAIRAKVDEILQLQVAAVGEALDEAVAEGAVSAVDTRTTAESIVAYVQGLLLLAKLRNDPSVLHRLVHGVVRLAVNPL